jgi:hypothetical protein
MEVLYELPLQANDTASEIYLHKFGAVRSVDWVFVIGLPPRRWLDEYVTLDTKFYILHFKEEVAAAPITATIFFFIAFLEKTFITNAIFILNSITEYNYNMH